MLFVCSFHDPSVTVLSLEFMKPFPTLCNSRKAFETLCYLFLAAVFCLTSLASEISSIRTYRLAVKQLTDEQYPDNPDIGYMAKDYDHMYFAGGVLESDTLEKGSFTFLSPKGDVLLKNIDLLEFIPSAPKHLRSDAYLTELAIVNQEWNRNQVKFLQGEFESSNEAVVRVDLARNCLNAYLWEVILYTQEDGKQLPLAHGWFDFPQEYYKELFEKRNGLPYETYRAALENWVDPKAEKVELSKLRTVKQSLPIKGFTEHNLEMYPLKKARLKKKKEIITPESFTCMKDFHSDASRFATFSPPGCYTRSSPRVTELGRLQTLSNVKVKSIETTTGLKSSELELVFNDDSQRQTNLYFGGLDFDKFPILSPDQSNAGYKISMGFSNHTFYETYQEHLQWDSLTAPYYGFFTNEKGEWLDSHKIGIDGPIFHWDSKDSKVLHVWLLSFERHALVGHYTIAFQERP